MNGRKFEIEDDMFRKDGEPFRIIGGDLHYFRILPQVFLFLLFILLFLKQWHSWIYSMPFRIIEYLQLKVYKSKNNNNNINCCHAQYKWGKIEKWNSFEEIEYW